jgi:hypothetical protein
MARERITVMFNPELKTEIDHMAVNQKVFPCEVLEEIVRLGLQAHKDSRSPKANC